MSAAAPGAAHDRAILYLHGGGYVVGDLDTHDRIMRLLALKADCPVLGIDYALSPERRFPVEHLSIVGEELRYGALVVTVVAGLLMVSRLRYNSFKGSGTGPKAERVPFVALLIAVGVLIALWVDPPKTLLIVASVYALSGPVLWFWRRHEGARAEAA